MGRYKYDRFKGAFSTKTVRAIIEGLKDRGVREDEYDWDVLEIRVKRANKNQRHRFLDTIHKLETFLESAETGAHCVLVDVYRGFDIPKDTDSERFAHYDKVHAIGIKEFVNITGRNRKTVVDWLNKDFLCSRYNRKTIILIEDSIKKMKKIAGLGAPNKLYKYTRRA